MHEITREGTSFEIKNYPWDVSGYKPKTIITIGYDDNGFNVHGVSYETEIHASRFINNTDISADNCMELFMKFAPDTDINYINIEINPNSAVNNSVRENRENSQYVSDEMIKMLDVKATVYEDRWEIDYYIPVSYIKKLIPTYEHKTGNIIKGNLYKCSEDFNPHFGCFSNIEWEEPDFHRPEFFTEFKLV